MRQGSYCHLTDGEIEVHDYLPKVTEEAGFKLRCVDFKPAHIHSTNQDTQIQLIRNSKTKQEICTPSWAETPTLYSGLYTGKGPPWTITMIISYNHYAGYMVVTVLWIHNSSTSGVSLHFPTFSHFIHLPPRITTVQLSNITDSFNLFLNFIYISIISHV